MVVHPLLLTILLSNDNPSPVGWDESLRHEKCRTSHMISDDSHMFSILFALTSEAIAREVAVCLVA